MTCKEEDVALPIVKQQQPQTQQPINVYDEANLLVDPDRFNHVTYNEQYVLRKETIGFGMDLAMKKLYRESAQIKQQYKKRAAQQKDGKVEVDYDQYQVKKEFQKLRDLYCRESKSNIVMKKNLEKLKARVDKVTRDIKIKEYLNLKDGDIARIIKPVQKPPQQPSQPSRHAG